MERGKDRWAKLTIDDLELKFDYTKEDIQLAHSVISTFLSIEHLINDGRIKISRGSL